MVAGCGGAAVMAEFDPLFMNNRLTTRILSRALTGVIDAAPSAQRPSPGKPCCARLRDLSHRAPRNRFPQILWIKLCVSCKFTR
jgi:hypothetical protein